MHHSVLCTAIVPYDSAAKWFPTLTTPSDCGLTLVRDACSWDLGMRRVPLYGSGKRLLTDNLDAILRPPCCLQVVAGIRDTCIAGLYDLFWIMFVPTNLNMSL